MPKSDEHLVITFNIDFHVKLEPGEDDLTHTEQGFLFDALEQAGDQAMHHIRGNRAKIRGQAQAANEASPTP